MKMKQKNFDHEIKAVILRDLPDEPEPDEPAELNFDSGSPLMGEDDDSADETPPMEEFFQHNMQSGLRAARIRKEQHAEARRRLARARDYRGGVSGQNQRAEEVGARGALGQKQWDTWRACFGGRCPYCDSEVASTVIEHVVPLAHGGENTVYNVVPACWSCNTAKGPKEPLRWLKRTARTETFFRSVLLALARANEKGPKT